MKSLKTSICLSLIFLLNNSYIKAQVLSTRLGIYQFTDATASEFYKYAPTLLVDYDAWKISQMDLQFTAGFAYNKIDYNSHHHYLYAIPFLISVNYNLPNPGSKLYPTIGFGPTFIEKIDKNKDLSKTHHSLVYGYHLSGKLVYELHERLFLTLNLSYNLLIPHSNEELNINGMLITVGISRPLILHKSLTRACL